MGVENSRFILALTILLVITSIISFGFFFYSAQSLFNAISGYVTSTGQANFTVESSAILNFTTSQINWGSGRVNSGSGSAGLNTFETNNVTNGNWTLQTAGGLRIQNLGNVDLTLNLSGTKTAAQMIGGTGPGYKWNISNVEANSCQNATGGSAFLALNVFYDVNTTTTLFCPNFKYEDNQDTIRIDFNLTVPSDSLTGALGDTITATAFNSYFPIA